MVKEGSKQQYGLRSTINQIIVTLVSNSALLSSGMTLGFTAVALPHMLQDNDTVLAVTPLEASWIASLAAISTPLGCLASGPLIDKFGRKFGLLVLNVPALIGWLCIAIHPTLTQMYIGRVLTGIACGLSSSSATVYVAEVTTSELRGFFVTGSSISISTGVTIVYIFGLIFKENWQMIAVISSVFPIMSILLIWCLLPESPVWLMAHDKEEAAGSALCRLRGVTQVSRVKDELDAMADLKSKRNPKESLCTTLKEFRKPEAYKPLIIMNIFFLFQQLSGIFVVVFYAVSVVREAGVTIDPFVVAVLIGLIRLLFTILAAYLSKKLGRRCSSIISGIGMTASLLVLGTYLVMLKQTVNAPETSLIPFFAILIYILTSTLGFLTLPWAMIGEVFPVRVRGVAGGITTCMTYIVSFFAVHLYPIMVVSLQHHGVFYFYGTMALLGTLFVYIFLPETEGKTLAEIEEHFAGKKRRRQTTQDEEEMFNGTKLVSIVPKGQLD